MWLLKCINGYDYVLKLLQGVVSLMVALCVLISPLKTAPVPLSYSQGWSRKVFTADYKHTVFFFNSYC